MSKQIDSVTGIQAESVAALLRHGFHRAVSGRAHSITDNGVKLVKARFGTAIVTPDGNINGVQPFDFQFP